MNERKFLHKIYSEQEDREVFNFGHTVAELDGQHSRTRPLKPAAIAFFISTPHFFAFYCEIHFISTLLMRKFASQDA